MFAFSLLDFIVDMMLVSDLASQDQPAYAAMLSVFSIIPFIYELVAKYYTHIWRRAGVGDPETCLAWKKRGPFRMNIPTERMNFFVSVAIIQIGHFLMEDCTTLFVWWQSGIYRGRENGEEVTTANLLNMVVTLIHGFAGLIAICVIFYQATAKDIFKEQVYEVTRSNLCCEKPLIYMFFPLVVLAISIFWIVFAIAAIMGGTYYNKRSEKSIGSNKGIGVMYAVGIIVSLQGGYIARCRIKKALIPLEERQMRVPGPSRFGSPDRPVSVDFSSVPV
jgi:hypothetical protein